MRLRMPRILRRHLPVLGELGIAIHHLRDGLADDDEAHDDGLLGALVLKKVLLGQALHEAAGIGCGLLDVIEVVGQSMVLAHTGCASASTWPGISAGRRGQQIDVEAEQRFNSSCRPPRSSSVAPGSASTSRSMSLPSRRCHAAPNRKRVGSRCGNGLPLHALRFASCQAQQTVAWASFLIETR
jgi:hypothetical protein